MIESYFFVPIILDTLFVQLIMINLLIYLTLQCVKVKLSCSLKQHVT